MIQELNYVGDPPAIITIPKMCLAVVKDTSEALTNKTVQTPLGDFTTGSLAIQSECLDEKV